MNKQNQTSLVMWSHLMWRRCSWMWHMVWGQDVEPAVSLSHTIFSNVTCITIGPIATVLMCWLWEYLSPILVIFNFQLLKTSDWKCRCYACFSEKRWLFLGLNAFWKYLLRWQWCLVILDGVSYLVDCLCACRFSFVVYACFSCIRRCVKWKVSSFLLSELDGINNFNGFYRISK